MKGIIQGLVAGLLAGFVLAVLSFVDYGHGDALAAVATWLGLGGTGTEQWSGFLLLLVLGSLFGALFGAAQGRTQIALGRSLIAGLATGIVFWVIIWLLFGVLINHQKLDLTGFLYSFVPLLFYGMLLGSIYFQRTARKLA